jgi:aminopeptidase YwaD
MKYPVSIIFFLFISGFICSQNLQLYEQIISELSSEEYAGRGVSRNGDRKAAEYLSEVYSELGLSYFEDEYYQYFTMSVNHFPGNMQLSIDGVEMRPGIDFVVTEYSRGIKGDYNLFWFDPDNHNLSFLLDTMSTALLQNTLIVMDYDFSVYNRHIVSPVYNSEIIGLVLLQEAPVRWYLPRSNFVINQTIIWVDKDVFPCNSSRISLDIQNVFVENYQTQNVIGFIEGNKYPEDFIVFTAHYDHLGTHGKDVFYPGANDNASGTAMLVILAEYFIENPPDVSIAFMAFGGEETGLLGSKYYVENPIFPLENIKALINMDMVADNPDDIYFELSKTADDVFEIFSNLINTKEYFKDLNIAELRAMSDHYFFAIAEVPTVFIALDGEVFGTLHTLNDIVENISFEKIPVLFNLLRDFVSKYSASKLGNY